MNYYNEWDAYAAAWLSNLQAAGHLPIGTVDRRSIRDVMAADVCKAMQVHFFAGIGGWPLALRMANWPNDKSVWTGSCPCQPFSVAGKRKGVRDDRHLWPEFRRIIAECLPPVVFGEQVASKDGREWLAGVRADLEALGYAVGAADLCAAGVGAPHIRQRLYWVADRFGPGLEGLQEQPAREELQAPERGGISGRRVEHAKGGGKKTAQQPGQGKGTVEANRIGGVVDPNLSEQYEWTSSGEQSLHYIRCAGDFWGAFDLIPCIDGKSRRVEPGTFPLAHGVPARMGKLRAYGNAIVPSLAAEFVKAYLDLRRNNFCYTKIG